MIKLNNYCLQTPPTGDVSAGGGRDTGRAGRSVAEGESRDPAEPRELISIRAGGVNGLNIHQGDRRIRVEPAGRSCVRGRTVSVNTSERDVGKMSTCAAERALSQLTSPAGMLALAC